MLPISSKSTVRDPLRAVLCCLSLTALLAAQAPETATTTAPRVSQTSRVSQGIAQHVRSGADAYSSGEYPQSLAHYAAALELGDDSPTTAYNAACSASLAGSTDAAFEFLATAIGLGWVDAEHLGRDTDLKRLHGDPRWKPILDRATAAARALETRWQSSAFRTPFETDLSASEKAAGFAKLWSEVKYNFVHFDQVPDLDWDATFVETLPRVLATTSTYDYYRELLRVVAKLKDGHTNVYLPTALGSMECNPGIATRRIEGRVLVTALFDRSLKDAGLHVGTEIIRVDGVDVEEHATRNVAPFLCASTPQDRRRRLYGPDLLRGPLDEPVRLTVRSAEGIESEVEVRRQPKMVERLRRFARPSLRYEVLDGNIGYLELNSFGKQSVAKQFADTFPKIYEADSLVIDLRNNGGGNSGVGWEILTHLVREPFSTTRWHTLQYRPTMRAWGRQPMTPYGPEPRPFGRAKATVFDKPVVVLIGPATFSAAEDMVAVFDQVQRGKLMGQATGGSSGQPLMFDLPGGGRARVCTKHDSYADGSEFVGVGIVPDEVVEPTVADVRAGVDTVLEAALADLKSRAN